MATLFGMSPFLLKLYADAGYGGPKFRQGMARVCREVDVEIVRRCDAGKFVVLPKRWIVERTIAWLQRTAEVLAVHAQVRRRLYPPGGTHRRCGAWPRST